MHRPRLTIRPDTGLWVLARVLMAVVFLASGLAKLIDFQGGVAEMRAAGLEPAVLVNVLVALYMLLASALLILDRYLMLGAGLLISFLLLSILIVHRFWALAEPEAHLALLFALEHISLAGGLLALALASGWRKQLVCQSNCPT